MPLTEQELRESLRRATDAPPRVTDRLGAVERRVRRRRRRVVVATAVAVVVALAVVPLVRWLPDRLNRYQVTHSEVTPAQMDAMMKYATFVALWDGTSVGLTREDSGVVGVSVTSTLPPYNCTVARPDEGQSLGTQPGWVLAQPSAIRGDKAATPSFGAIGPFVLWPEGVASCDPPLTGTMLAQPPTNADANLSGWAPAFSQSLADPSVPALDVEAVYRAIPQDRITDLGRGVLVDYESKAPKDYGTPGEQRTRVLTALAEWLSVAMSRDAVSSPGAISGPALLTSDDYVGTAQLPHGFSAVWDQTADTFCVVGSMSGSGVAHVTEEGIADVSDGLATAYDGPCPARYALQKP